MKLSTDNVPQICDGCGQGIEPGRQFVIWKNDITCKACIEQAAQKFAATDEWGRNPLNLL